MKIEYDKEWCMRMAQVERLQEALDAAVAAERERLLSAAEETKWAMYSGEKTFADALREIMGPNVGAEPTVEAGFAGARRDDGQRPE